MPVIHVTDRAGNKTELSANSGESLMENLTANGYDDIEAICGGGCACATCHVYIDGDWAGKLPKRDVDEEDLVSGEGSYDEARSRLSCQIEVTDALEGMTITLAPEG